jgi:hypothetical protein
MPVLYLVHHLYTTNKFLTIPPTQEAELDYLKQRQSRNPLGMFFCRSPKYQTQ